MDPYIARAFEAFSGHRDELPVFDPAVGPDGWGAVATGIGFLLWEMRVGRDGQVAIRRTDALAAFWGDMLDELTMESFDGAIHPKDRERHWQALEQAAATGSSESEVRVRGLDGRQRWLRTHTVAAADPDGGLVLRGAILDITAQRAASPADEGGAPLPLTARQLQVLQLTGEGATAAEIAERLHLSRRTVENHVARAMRSLGVRRKRDAVALARERGMLV
jgi:DNA-binding CsgD family transcriptional regulator